MYPEPNSQSKIPFVEVRHQQCNLVKLSKQFKLWEAVAIFSLSVSHF